MSQTFVIRPEAEDDLAEAKVWYDGKRAGLGDDFLDHVEVAFETVRRRPLVPSPVYGDVRRVRVTRFPYMIYYRADDDQITVLAVYHTSRDPGGWQARA